MSFVVYIAVLIAGLVSVMLGLQLANTPHLTRTAGPPPLVEPIRHAPTAAAAKPAAPVTSAKPDTLAAPAPPPVQAPAIEARSQTTAQSVQESSVPGCNVSLCETHYPKSFRAADCTYQPNIGPRRICRK